MHERQLSIPAYLARHTVVPLIAWALSPDIPLATRRRRFEQVCRPLAALAPAVERSAETVGTVPGEWLRPGGVDAPLRTVVYCHGGGFQLGSARAYRGFAAQLARRLNAQVFVAEYRLAPEHPFPAAVEDIVAVCRALLARGLAPGSIALLGDSAGGALALAACVALRDMAVPLPGALALLSPWLDLSLSGEQLEQRAARDPILRPAWLREAAQAYCSRAELALSLASPLFANLEAMPATAVFAGSEELLLDDALRLVRRLRGAGVPVRWWQGEGLWHVWPALCGWIPEAGAAVDQLRRHLHAHLHDPAAAPRDAVPDSGADLL